MEVDKILYIFGSFTRKKDKRKSMQPQSLSAGSSPLHRRSLPEQSVNIPPRTAVYQDSRALKEGECAICKKGLVEPRLLSCLHSFCTKCLQNLHQEGEELWADVDGGSIQFGAGESASGSAGSGYESEPRDHSGSEASWGEQKPLKHAIFTRKISGTNVQHLVCPTCAYETPLPLGGIAALPLNCVLLRRILASDTNEVNTASILCDLCTSDNKAESRCEQCLVVVCGSCKEAHARQKSTSRHSLHPLYAAATAVCSQHPEAELSVYCATCQQVVCRECCVIAHSGHALSSAARAAAERARLLRDACQRARYVPEHVHRATRTLHVQAAEVDNQAARVEAEVAAFSEQYRRAVEAHGRSLSASAARARARYRQKFAEEHKELEDKVVHANEAVKFAEEVLSQSRDEDVLSLSTVVLRRLELVCEVSAPERRCEVRFAASAPAPGALLGRLLTRASDPEHCVLDVEGLQDLRVDCAHETSLEVRDELGQRTWCGGEQVAGYFRRRDSSATPHFAKVQDRGDGVYSLLICPTSPGAYLLAVTLNNTPIKGSPFPCAVRVSRAHNGRFHCCSFCSSGGKKDAVCGCSAAMGGGYKGCGHGHAGHPGSRHWSCCGSTDKRGACTRPLSQTYQFSL